jgi:hypothetical protein
MPRVVGIVILLIGGGIVAGLAIMYVARGRAGAERLRCADNQRRIGQLYLLDEAQVAKAYPAGTVRFAELPPERRLSWIVPGLTRLGEKKLADSIDVTAPWNSDLNTTPGRALLLFLVCPAIPEIRAADGAAALHYPGIAGVGPDAALKPADAPGAGMFRYDAPTFVSDVKDGLANTLMLVESANHPGPWIAGGPSSVRPLDPAERPYLGRGRPFGGAHFGGANALNADGSGRFINENVSPRVLELLAGIADGVRADDSQ